MGKIPSKKISGEIHYLITLILLTLGLVVFSTLGLIIITIGLLWMELLAQLLGPVLGWWFRVLLNIAWISPIVMLYLIIGIPPRKKKK